MRYSGFYRAIGILHGEHRATWPIHFCNEIEIERLEEYRRRTGANKPSYTALVVKAIAKAVREISAEYPQINSYLRNVLGWKTIHTFDRISAGVAVSRDDAGEDQTVVSIVLDPERTPLSAITEQLRDHATMPVRDIPYVRNCYYLFRLPSPLQRLMLWVGKTFPEKRRLYRGTFTLTSVGKFGVDFQLTLPQASSLQFGFGSIRQRPVARDGQVIAAKTFFLTLSFDRRLMNGKPCAKLMERIRTILESAEFDDEAGCGSGDPASIRRQEQPAETVS